MTTLAEQIAAGMRADGYATIGWGDNRLVDYVAAHTRLKIEHPLNRMRAAMNAMERAPHMFEKFWRRGMDIRGRDRLTRCFRLKEAYR